MSVSYCANGGCDRPVYARALCSRHYMRQHRRDNGDQRRVGACSCCGETKPMRGRGLCNRCYTYNRLNDTLDMPTMSPSPHVPVRVRLQMAAEGRGPDECHPWGGHVDSNGYGGAGGKKAHVAAWVEAGNPDPKPGEQIDHTCCWKSDCSGGQGCPHRRCVNTRHLRCVPAVENVAMQSNVRRRRLTCKVGHPKTSEFGYRLPDGSWRCRPCHNNYQKEWSRTHR